MANHQPAGKTALITGASSGLGVDFARELAAKGTHLILVARRAEQLAQVQKELHERYDVQVEYRVADLGDPAACEDLHQTLKSEGRTVDILINNAGFGLFGNFCDLTWERTNQMLQVDVVALTHLTRLFVNDMVARGDGRIMLISSVGAFQPSPGYAAYAAAKSYVLSLGHALHFELRGTGVTCTTVCPGVTATEFLQVSGQKQTWFHKATMMTSAAVARMAVKRMLAGRPEIVTGIINALSAFSMRFLPRQLQALVAYFAMRNK